MRQTAINNKLKYTFQEGLTDFSDLYLFYNEKLIQPYIFPSSINGSSAKIEINFYPDTSSVFINYLDAVVIHYPLRQTSFDNSRLNNDIIKKEKLNIYNSIRQLNNAYGRVIDIIKEKINLDKSANRLQTNQVVIKNINNVSNDQYYVYNLADNQIINNQLTKTYKVSSSIIE